MRRERLKQECGKSSFRLELPAGVTANLSQSSFEGLVKKPDHSRARRDRIVKTEKQ